MKNIHILPTHKPSKFFSTAGSNGSKGGYALEEDYVPNTRQTFRAINMFITSDEEIKIGDWFITDHLLWKANQNIHLINPKRDKKIILTTDQDLIKDGVQSIDDEFLEWFIKNPSCEKVEVEKAPYDGTKSIDKYWGGEYKIIIRKEEVLLQSSIDGEPIWGEAKKDINTCKNFDREIGYDLVDCPCKKEEILEEAKQMMVTQEDILEQIALTEARGEKIVKYLNRYKGDSIYNEIALAIEFGYQLKLEEDEK